jgi:type IV secretory pathway TrbD component
VAVSLIRQLPTNRERPTTDDQMPRQPVARPVYRSLNGPLTIAGADRRLFLLAIVMGAATFTLAASALAGVLMAAALYVGARWLTAHDPQALRIMLRSATARRHYDPGKFVHVLVHRSSSR